MLSELSSSKHRFLRFFSQNCHFSALGFIRLADSVRFHVQSLCAISSRFTGQGLVLRNIDVSLGRGFAGKNFGWSGSFLVIAKVVIVGKIFSRWVCSLLFVKKIGVR
jgi:hypothetical protein